MIVCYGSSVGSSSISTKSGLWLWMRMRWMRKMIPPAPVTETSIQAWMARPKTAACAIDAPWLTSEVLTAHSKGPMAPGELGIR